MKLDAWQTPAAPPGCHTRYVPVIRPHRSPSSAPPPAARIVVLGGDPVAGRALALLLEGRGYRAHFLAAGAATAPGAFHHVRFAVLADQPPPAPDILLPTLLTAAGIPWVALAVPGGEGSSGNSVRRLSLDEVARAIEAHRATDWRGEAA